MKLHIAIGQYEFIEEEVTNADEARQAYDRIKQVFPDKAPQQGQSNYQAPPQDNSPVPQGLTCGICQSSALTRGVKTKDTSPDYKCSCGAAGWMNAKAPGGIAWRPGRK